MNVEELRQLRVAADAVALKSLFSWQCQLIHGLLLSLPESQRTQCVEIMVRKLAENKADYMQMTFPEMSAVESDLFSAEVQEASDRWATAFQKSLAQFLPAR